MTSEVNDRLRLVDGIAAYENMLYTAYSVCIVFIMYVKDSICMYCVR